MTVILHQSPAARRVDHQPLSAAGFKRGNVVSRQPTRALEVRGMRLQGPATRLPGSSQDPVAVAGQHPHRGVVHFRQDVGRHTA